MQPEWDALVYRDPLATAYQTYAVSVGGWRIDAAEMDLEPVVIAVRDDAGTLVGLAPLAIWTTRHHGIPWRILGSLPGTWASSWDILALPEWEEQVVAAVLEFLVAQQHRFDQFLVRRVGRKARVARMADSLPGVLTTWRTPASPVGHWLLVQPGWTGVNDYLNRKQRSLLRRSRRRVYDDVGARLISDGMDPHEAARRIATTHLARWGTERSEFAHPGRVDRFGDLLEAVFARGQGGCLEARAPNGESMAGMICLRLRHSAVLYRTAYNPAFADCSPGVALDADTIDALIQMGISTISFGFGNDPYKRHWSNLTTEVCSVSACAPTVRTWGARLGLAALSRSGLSSRSPDPWTNDVPGRLRGY